jgi:hypothetical protein
MELETPVVQVQASVTEVLRRVSIDYHPDGSIEVAQFYTERITLPGQAPMDSATWKPYSATYPDQDTMVGLASGASGAPVEQITAILTGFIAILGGMRAALDRPPEPVTPIDIPTP